MTSRQGIATDQLINVIQVLQLGRKTGELQVERQVGSQIEEGMLKFVHGQITFAECGRLDGQAALHWLQSWGQCRFVFNNVVVKKDTGPLLHSRQPSSELPNIQQRQDSTILPNIQQQQDAATLPSIRQRRDSAALPNIQQQQDAAILPSIRQRRDSAKLPSIQQRRDSEALPNIQQRRDSEALPNIRQRRDSEALPNMQQRRDSAKLPNIQQRRDSAKLPSIEQQQDAAIQPVQYVPAQFSPGQPFSPRIQFSPRTEPILAYTTVVPRRIYAADEGMYRLTQANISRLHQHLYLLIDGQRSCIELVRLINRQLEEVIQLLKDLERVGIIQLS
jgi:hypothetical protein